MNDILGIRENAGDVPGIAWAYWALVRLTPPEMFGLYGMDDRRTRMHDELCRHYRIDREMSKTVTDNLDKYPCSVDMHDALQTIARKCEVVEYRLTNKKD